jgi:monoamine oxidase
MTEPTNVCAGQRVRHRDRAGVRHGKLVNVARGRRTTYTGVARLQLMQRVPMGSVWKVHAVYDRPFWREQGLNGQVSSDAFPTKVTFDVSPAEPNGPGIMMGFIEGQDAIDATLMSDAARKAKILEAFAFYFGPAMARPRAYIEMNWQAEALSAGGYTGVCPPGVMTGFGKVWRAPVGRLHGAGTETSPVWSGYMEGAVRSGERATQEILPGRLSALF